MHTGESNNLVRETQVTLDASFSTESACSSIPFLFVIVRMINRENTNDTMNLHPTIGVLTDTEVLLVDIVQGKRVLRSILLPPGMSEPIGLLEHVWQSGLAEVWVMPATTLSQTAKCAWFEEINDSWVAVVHPNNSEPDRPLCALLLPKGNSQREARRLTFVFPEHAGW